MSLPKRPARVLEVTDPVAGTAAVVGAFLRAGFRVRSAPDAPTVQLELGSRVLPLVLAPFAVLPGRAGNIGKYARVVIERGTASQLVVGLAGAFLANDVVPLVVTAMDHAVADLDHLGLLKNAGPVISVRDLPPTLG